jgi:hypothetical protein
LAAIVSAETAVRVQIVADTKKEKQMETEPQWLSTNVAPEIIHLSPITIKDKMGGKRKGHLQVEQNNGLLKISANYNFTHLENKVVAAKFYLTQEQLDEYLDKGEKCVLNVPVKK